MDEEADADWQLRFAEEMETRMMEAMLGGKPRKRRQTALRMRGRAFETVELDDDGKVIEPVQCICGKFAMIHSPRCPFALVYT